VLARMTHSARHGRLYATTTIAWEAGQVSITEQSVVLYVLTAAAVIGGIVGLVACVRAYGSYLHGSISAIVASDDDLRPHPRLRRPR